VATSGSAKSSPDIQEATPAGDSAGGAGSAAPDSPLTQSRKQIQSVSITLSTKPADVEDVSDRVIRIADTLGGFVQRSSITARRSAELTVRVPADKLQPALAQLSRIAHVSSRTQDTEDVTDQAAQLNSAVRDARAYRDSLRNRLAHATTDSQAASLRARLQRAEQRLRSRERQVAQLSRQTSYATAAAVPRRRPPAAGRPATRCTTPAACSRSWPAWR
jgi:chromosome segregation ATPase